MSDTTIISTTTSFAAALADHPERRRREAELASAIPWFIMLHAHGNHGKLLTRTARAAFQIFWCNVAELAVARDDGRLDDATESLFDQMQTQLRRQQPCPQAHAKVFRTLLICADPALDFFFDAFWSNGGAFFLPNDIRAAEVALRPLRSVVSLANYGEGERARGPMIKHLRQLHYRAPF